MDEFKLLPVICRSKDARYEQFGILSDRSLPTQPRPDPNSHAN